MTDLIQSFSEISARYDAVLCDLWGCLHNGQRPFPDAVAALQNYRRSGGIVVLLTNAGRPSTAVRQQLDILGVPTDAYDLVVSSGDASQGALVSGLVGTEVFHLGPDKDAKFFTDLAPELDPSTIKRVPLKQAQGVVCTGLFDDQTETPEDYRASLLYAKTKGLKLLCTNPDIVVDYGDKRIYCAGAIAALYTEMGGESLYFGKPHPPIYDLARLAISALINTSDDHILAIGDGIETDIQGGLSEGMGTLFITGGLASAEFGDDPDNPNPQALDAFYSSHQISPTAAISALR